MKKMKVALDRGPLTSGHRARGIGVHTRELIAGIKRLKDEDIKLDALDFEEADLTKYDLVHYQNFHPFFLTLPSERPTKKVVVTIHDLIPLIYPKHYPPGLTGKINFLRQKRRLRNVDAIITISETSKKDISRFLGIHPDKVHVVYLAPREIFKLITDRRLLTTVRNKYKLPESFVLYVGDVNYNKNILGLIKACKIAKLPLVIAGKQALDIEVQGIGLDVLAGPQDWIRFLFNIPHPELAHFRDLLDEFGSNKKILRLGFIPDDDLVAIYNLATVYCQPSFYEGFGLPVLEAMACKAPVVAAKTQALVEIAENAVLFADPKDSKDVAHKITEVIKNSRTKEGLIKKGLESLKEFSWRKTAKETIRVYKQILQK